MSRCVSFSPFVSFACVAYILLFDFQATAISGDGESEDVGDEDDAEVAEAHQQFCLPMSITLCIA